MARTDQAGSVAPLPPGWTTGIDPCSGKRVYMHALSGKVAFRHPNSATIVREAQARQGRVQEEGQGEAHRGHSGDDAASSAVMAAVLPSHNFCLGCGDCIEVIRLQNIFRKSGAFQRLIATHEEKIRIDNSHKLRGPSTPLTSVPSQTTAQMQARVCLNCGQAADPYFAAQRTWSSPLPSILTMSCSPSRAACPPSRAAEKFSHKLAALAVRFRPRVCPFSPVGAGRIRPAGRCASAPIGEGVVRRAHLSPADARLVDGRRSAAATSPQGKRGTDAESSTTGTERPTPYDACASPAPG